MAFTPSMLSSAEPRWQMMQHGLKREVLSLKHILSHRYVDTMQECWTFKNVASCLCDWLFLVLILRIQGTGLRKIDGKIDE